jgi:hypothetical protein
MQGLTEFQSDHAGAYDRRRCRQIVPLKDIVVDDQAIAQRLERIGVSGARAGGNDDALGRNAGVGVDLKVVVVNEIGMPADTILLRKAIDAAQHQADKAVAFALDAFHDFPAIYADCAIQVHAECGCPRNAMCGVCGGDEELARHAANARAGGP